MTTLTTLAAQLHKLWMDTSHEDVEAFADPLREAVYAAGYRFPDEPADDAPDSVWKFWGMNGSDMTNAFLYDVNSVSSDSLDKFTAKLAQYIEPMATYATGTRMSFYPSPSTY